MLRENPCLQCGACCAKYRVSFYWGEAERARGGAVPPELTEDLTGLIRCMKGTNQKPPRCIALEGRVGTRVRCAIYAHRPGACREFGICREHGVSRASEGELERCSQARAAWGLRPLTRSLQRRQSATERAFQAVRGQKGNRAANVRLRPRPGVRLRHPSWPSSACAPVLTCRRAKRSLRVGHSCLKH